MTAQDYNASEKMKMIREKLLIQTKLLMRPDFQNQSNARPKQNFFKRSSIPQQQ